MKKGRKHVFLALTTGRIQPHPAGYSLGAGRDSEKPAILWGLLPGNA